MAIVYVRKNAVRSRYVYIVANNNLCYLVVRTKPSERITEQMCKDWIKNQDYDPMKALVDPPDVSGLDKIYDDYTEIKTLRGYRHDRLKRE